MKERVYLVVCAFARIRSDDNLIGYNSSDMKSIYSYRLSR